MGAYGWSDRCLGKLLATGESVYVPKVLTGTRCANHAELPARGRDVERRCSRRDGRRADGMGGDEG